MHLCNKVTKNCTQFKIPKTYVLCMFFHWVLLTILRNRKLNLFRDIRVDLIICRKIFEFSKFNKTFILLFVTTNRVYKKFTPHHDRIMAYSSSEYLYYSISNEYLKCIEHVYLNYNHCCRNKQTGGQVLGNSIVRAG